VFCAIRGELKDIIGSPVKVAEYRVLTQPLGKLHVIFWRDRLSTFASIQDFIIEFTL
jgi:hypothetical protein